MNIATGFATAIAAALGILAGLMAVIYGTALLVQWME